MRYSPLIAAALALSLVGCARQRAAAPAAPAAADDHAAHAMEPAARHEDGAAEMRHNRHFLMSTESLATRLQQRGTILIHVGRTDSSYLAGHIPGARFLPLAAVGATIDGIPMQFPPLADLQRAFQGLQIGDSARIVIYGDEPLLAARAWAALDLLGQAERTALLDGGLVKWRAESRAVETGPVMTTMIFIPFTPRPRGDMLVTAEWVRARLRDSTVLLIDARPAAQFAGAEPAPAGGAPHQIPEARRGHIPGARNLFWMSGLVAADNPVLKPMHELHHMVWQPAGTDDARVRTIVVYCRSGLQSSHAYFQARYIGYPDVRLYDGSFIEWSGLDPAGYPVER